MLNSQSWPVTWACCMEPGVRQCIMGSVCKVCRPFITITTLFMVAGKHSEAEESLVFQHPFQGHTLNNPAKGSTVS